MRNKQGLHCKKSVPLGFSSHPTAGVDSELHFLRANLLPFPRTQIRLSAAVAAMAASRVLLLLAVAAASLFAADARPCRTFLVAFPADPNPNPSGGRAAAHHHYRGVPHVATVVTVFRVRRLGPHQIRRTEALPAAAASQSEVASSMQDRAKDILVVVSGLLFGFGCGALTAATMYLVWSLIASTCASGYDDVYSDDEDQLSDSESPKKAGYVIIHDAEEYGAGKN